MLQKFFLLFHLLIQITNMIIGKLKRVIGYFLYSLKRYSRRPWYKISLKQRESRLKKIWFERKGYELDLINPKTFTEKIQWYKLYYDNPKIGYIVDKHTFKDYIKEKIDGGENLVAKLYAVWQNPDEIDFSNLPNSCVIKSNCSDEGNNIIIIKDLKKENITNLKKLIIPMFDKRSTIINSSCSGYYNIVPKVIVEELLECGEYSAPREIKVFCFNGKPEVLYTTCEHFENTINSKLYPISFYSLDWNRIDVLYGNHPPYIDAPKPQYLDDMIRLSFELAKEFPFVRVDFFETPSKLYLAELTFYPGGGWSQYNPSSFDEYLGNLFILPN